LGLQGSGHPLSQGENVWGEKCPVGEKSVGKKVFEFHANESPIRAKRGRSKEPTIQQTRNGKTVPVKERFERKTGFEEGPVLGLLRTRRLVPRNPGQESLPVAARKICKRIPVSNGGKSATNTPASKK